MTDKNGKKLHYGDFVLYRSTGLNKLVTAKIIHIDKHIAYIKIEEDINVLRNYCLDDCVLIADTEKNVEKVSNDKNERNQLLMLRMLEQ